MPTAPELELLQRGEGPPIFALTLPERLAVVAVESLCAEVLARVEELSGVSFALLVDTRGVRGAEEGATQRLQRLEMELAGRGLLRVAHVVRFKEMGEKLKAVYAALGYPDLIGTFLERSPAEAFLNRPPEPA